MQADMTAYDVVPYYSVARTGTNVDRLAALGRMLGIATADPNACRVLELGCGDGGNVLPMALSMPGSSFVGIDLSPAAVERARHAAAETGIGNASFLQGDIRALPPELTEFDYVIAHGVYSWVPPEVRAALLRAVRERMRPGGVAFVSYNALPGDHIRGVVRGMMKMHTAHITDPRKRLEQARALLALLARVPGEAGDVYRPLLQSEVGRAMQSSDELLYHDDLADISQPFYFSEFMGAAAAEGLQFLCEADFSSMSVETLPGDIADLLRGLAAHDLIAKEQYLDFLTCRGFRQTLLCHSETPVDRGVTTERLRQLRFVCEAKRTEVEGPPEFKHRNGSALRTDEPVLLAAMERLIAENPLSVAFDDLAAGSGALSAEQVETLAHALFRAFSAGVVDIRLHEPRVAVEPGDRPCASPWARRQAHHGRTANLYHEMVALDDPAQALLPLADGSRTVPELAAEAGITEAQAHTTLGELARLGLFVRS